MPGCNEGAILHNFKTFYLMRLYSWLLTCILFVAFGCNYTPDAEFFKEVPPPVTDGVMVDLTNQRDSVTLFENTSFTYQAQTGGRKLYSISVYFRESLVASFTTAEASFQLSNSGLQQGAYPLRIEVFTSSGSKSIADVVGAEQIKLTRQWVAIVDRSKPTPVRFTSVAPYQGTLKIRWTRGSHPNFKSYRVWKYQQNPFIEDNYALEWTRDVANRDTLSLNDNTFAGGGARYEIAVIGDNLESTKDEIRFSSEYNTDLRYEWTSKTEVRLTWRKIKFPANLLYYVVGGGGVSITKTNASDTTVTINPQVRFGNGIIFNAAAYAIGQLQVPASYSATTVRMGNTIPVTRKPFYNKALHKYFALRTDDNNVTKLVRLNGTTFEIEVESSYPVNTFSISDNGQHLYAGYSNTVKQIDPLTLNEVTSYTYSALKLTVSDNNHVLIQKDNGTVVVKMPENTVLATFGNANSTLSTSKYLMYGSALYEWNGTSYTLKHTYEAENFQYSVFDGDKHVVMIYYGGTRVADIASNSIINQFPYYSDNVEVDRDNNRFGVLVSTMNDKTYYIYDFNNTTPVYSIPVTDGLYYIQNNNLICSAGLQLPLSFFNQ